ncbi:MAG: hypothetical protein AAF941_02955 [Pseudomonadota bacterium]
MAKRRTPHRSAPSKSGQVSLADAQEKLKSLGTLGEGLGKLLDGVADLGEAGSSSKTGEFSIGGPERQTKGIYHMQFGTLEDAIAKRQSAPPRPKKPVKPFAPEREVDADDFLPNVFETAQGVMIVAEADTSSQDDVSVSVSEDGRGVTVSVAESSAVIELGRVVDPQSLSVSLVNGIMTANLAWKE